MSDWLHCNSCYKQPGDGTSYFLTQCGHLYCERCKVNCIYGWEQKCLLCGSLTPRALKLTSKLKPPVDAYMSDTYVVIKKICSDLKQVVQTMDFQNNHRRRYIMHLNELKSNQKAAVDKYQKGLQSELHAKMKVYMHSMEREMSKLRDENNYLKRILQNQGGHIRSPSGDRSRSNSSPTLKVNISPNMQHLPPNVHDRNIHNSLQKSPTDITNERVTIRTPPFGGKLGPILGTPSPTYDYEQPKSVPHPISLDYNMETPPRFDAQSANYREDFGEPDILITKPPAQYLNPFNPKYLT